MPRPNGGSGGFGTKEADQHAVAPPTPESVQKVQESGAARGIAIVAGSRWARIVIGEEENRRSADTDLNHDILDDGLGPVHDDAQFDLQPLLREVQCVCPSDRDARYIPLAYDRGVKLGQLLEVEKGGLCASLGCGRDGSLLLPWSERNECHRGACRERLTCTAVGSQKLGQTANCLSRRGRPYHGQAGNRLSVSPPHRGGPHARHDHREGLLVRRQPQTLYRLDDAALGTSKLEAANGSRP